MIGHWTEDRGLTRVNSGLVMTASRQRVRVTVRGWLGVAAVKLLIVRCRNKRDREDVRYTGKHSIIQVAILCALYGN